MANAALDTNFLDEAILFATKAHAGTERRGKGFPYIVHPLEAVEICATITPDQEILAAAALHDVVEDTAVTIDEIREKFGERVASLVGSETDTMPEGAPWHARKQAAIDKLAAASRDAKIVAIGDKLSNTRAIYRDWMTIGDEVWKIFHESDKKEHEWHYRGLLAALGELEGTFPYEEMKTLIEKVFSK